MSKIEFEQISENEIEVVIPPETPMEMVQQLTKSFIAKGLVEDLSKSTLSVRYFFRPAHKADDLADKLMKALEDMAKADELPYWHPKAQAANNKRIRDEAVAARRAKLSPSGSSESKPMSPAAYTSPHPKMVDNTPAAQQTAGGTGKRYAFIADKVKKDEDEDDVEKSNYGPKGAGQYTPADNARRKANNLDPVGSGPNTNAKAYSTKPGQLSGKAQADLTSRIQAAANKKQPVKHFTPEEIEEENKKRGLKKAWGQHLPFPSAEEEIMRLAKNEVIDGEQAAANQLLNLMQGKKMLNQHPVVEAMMAPPPPQPTNEQLFGGGVVTEEMAKAAEHKWNNQFNNWLTEATKPITQRFASEEEELAYWAKIKVADRDDGQSGY